jgi:hypothetical protein
VIDKLGGQGGELHLTLRQAVLDDDILPLDVAEVTQSFPERIDPARWGWPEPEEAYAMYLGRRLGVGSDVRRSQDEREDA